MRLGRLPTGERRIAALRWHRMDRVGLAFIANVRALKSVRRMRFFIHKIVLRNVPSSQSEPGTSFFIASIGYTDSRILRIPW